MIKLIVSDMDGTLSSPKRQLPADFESTLAQMDEKGVRFAVASGRPYKELYNIFSKYSEDIIYISENGAYCRYQDEVLYSDTFDKGEIGQFEKYFKGKGKGMMACCGYKCHYFRGRDHEDSEILKVFKIGYEIVDAFENIEDDIFQLTVFFEDGVGDVEDMPVYRELGHKYEIVKTNVHWMDIYSKHINKGVGIAQVHRRFNILPEETAAFGDFFNDIPMFNQVVESYCMESAPEDVKKHAKYVVTGEAGEPVTQMIRKIIKSN